MTAPCSLGFHLAFERLFEVGLMALVIGKDARLVDIPLEAAECVIKALAITYYDFRQTVSPPFKCKLDYASPYLPLQ